MRGLTIVVAGMDGARLRTALGLAATQAALGGGATLFLDGVAAVLPWAVEADAVAQSGAGLPSRAELIETCLALGVRIILCQSGLAMTGVTADGLDPRMETGGLAGVMAALGTDRLVMA